MEQICFVSSVLEKKIEVGSMKIETIVGLKGLKETEKEIDMQFCRKEKVLYISMIKTNSFQGRRR